LNSAQVRKDLAYFGEFGVRGVGYTIETLREHLTKFSVSIASIASELSARGAWHGLTDVTGLRGQISKSRRCLTPTNENRRKGRRGEIST
jgi:hypothetical protein